MCGIICLCYRCVFGFVLGCVVVWFVCVCLFVLECFVVNFVRSVFMLFI